MSIFQRLLQLLPILSQIKGGKNVELIIELIKIAEAEIERRMQERGKTRTEILAEAAATWDEAIQGADDLAKLGHENDG